MFVGVDLDQLVLFPMIKKWLLEPYICIARSVVRVPTDVVMVSGSQDLLVSLADLA